MTYRDQILAVVGVGEILTTGEIHDRIMAAGGSAYRRKLARSLGVEAKYGTFETVPASQHGHDVLAWRRIA